MLCCVGVLSIEVSYIININIIITIIFTIVIVPSALPSSLASSPYNNYDHFNYHYNHWLFFFCPYSRCYTADVLLLLLLMVSLSSSAFLIIIFSFSYYHLLLSSFLKKNMHILPSTLHYCRSTYRLSSPSLGHQNVRTLETSSLFQAQEMWSATTRLRMSVDDERRRISKRGAHLDEVQSSHGSQ